MPGPTLPNMSLICPALGGDAGVWSDELNTLLALVDSHNHSPGQGVKVPTAGLNINADLSLAGNGLTNIKSLAFTEIAALASGADTIFVNAADHELYWRSAAGVNVKLTSGSALNVAAFTGGIGGDYSAVGAALNYDAANTRYTFQGASPTFNWSILASGDLRLYQAGTTESVYTGIQVAPSLAASYNIVLPTALPSAARPVYLDNTGVLSTSAGMTRIGRQKFTAGGTYTPTAGTRAVLLRMVGGGGGGGGTTGSGGGAGNTCCGGGGASGLYGEVWISSGSAVTGGTVAIGAGGTGGFTSTAATSGGDTTVVVNGTTYTAKGGGGGGNQDQSVLSAPGGLTGSGLEALAFDSFTSPDGGPCITAIASGEGGSTPFGSGGGALLAQAGDANGLAGHGYGGGGGGAVTYHTTGISKAGSAGQSGLIIIDEFM